MGYVAAVVMGIFEKYLHHPALSGREGGNEVRS